MLMIMALNISLGLSLIQTITSMSTGVCPERGPSGEPLAFILSPGPEGPMCGVGQGEERAGEGQLPLGRPVLNGSAAAHGL